MIFKKHGSRYKVLMDTTPKQILLGWIQEFHYFGTRPARWVFRMSPNSYILSEQGLLTIAGFVNAINEGEPL